MAMIAGQGEARPERILRRFFSGFAEIWSQIHGLNLNFLPPKKKIRVIGLQEPGEDPYLEIERGMISGGFEFDFSANVLNTSKMALQNSIQALLGVYVSELAVQLGIIQPEGVYKLFRAYGRAHGQDPDQFLTAPSPTANKRRINAYDAVSQIMDNQIPDGEPAEPGGAIEHLQVLQEIAGRDEFGLMNPEQLEVFKGYAQEVMEKAAQQQQMQAQVAAARNFGGGGGGEPGRPPEGPPQDPTLDAPLQSGELRDESLPGAGGGGNTGVGV